MPIDNNERFCEFAVYYHPGFLPFVLVAWNGCSTRFILGSGLLFKGLMCSIKGWCLTILYWYLLLLITLAIVTPEQCVLRICWIASCHLILDCSIFLNSMILLSGFLHSMIWPKISSLQRSTSLLPSSLSKYIYF